eukprot:m.272999 g.272999  ORF g.272999 m.272999 type:complete len:1318 (+) comp17682_c0_seq4:176-4129(+)
MMNRSPADSSQKARASASSVEGLRSKPRVDLSKKASIRRRLPGWRSYQTRKNAQLMKCIKGFQCNEAIRLLRDGANPDFQDKLDDWNTPLVTAVMMFKPDRPHGTKLIRSLLEFNCDMELPNVLGATALHVAAHDGHVEVVDLLLAHGADPGAENNQSETPLHEAARRGATACVRLLVKRRSGPLPDVTGHSKNLVTLSLQSGHVNTAQELLQAYSDEAPDQWQKLAKNLRACFPMESGLERMILATTPAVLHDTSDATAADLAVLAAPIRQPTVAQALSTSSSPSPSPSGVRLKTPSHPGSKHSLTHVPLNKRRSTDLAASWMAPRTVEVIRSSEGLLGFSLFGSGQGNLPVVCLSEQTKPVVAKGSSALLEGDQLLAVGDTLVADMTHDDVVALIQSCAQRVQLHVLGTVDGAATPDNGKPGLPRQGSLVSMGDKAQVFYDAVVPLTTRPPEQGEVSGQTYHFISEELFKFFLDQDLLKEWGKYNQHCYGSLKNSVEVRPQRDATNQKMPANSSKAKACLLQRNPENVFGFVVNGGFERNELPFVGLVTTVDHLPESPTSISRGDAILSVNGVNVTKMTSAQTVAEIAKTTQTLTLILLERTHSHEAISIRPPPNPVAAAPVPSPLNPNASATVTSPTSPADGVKTTGATLAGSLGTKTIGSMSPKLKRKEAPVVDTTPALNDNYVPVRLTTKVLEQRSMTYNLASEAALGDGSVRTTKDLSKWVLGVLAATAQAEPELTAPPAIDPVEASEEPVRAEAEGKAEEIATPTPSDKNEFNPQDATRALAALKAKFKTDRAGSNDSFSRDRSNTVTSTRARVGSASQAVRQRVAQLSTPPSTQGSTADILVAGKDTSPLKPSEESSTPPPATEETFDQVDEHAEDVTSPAAQTTAPASVPPVTVSQEAAAEAATSQSTSTPMPAITVTSSSQADTQEHYANPDGSVDGNLEAPPAIPPPTSLQQAAMGDDEEAKAVLALFAESEEGSEADEMADKEDYLVIGAHDNLVEKVLEGIESKLDKADVLDQEFAQVQQEGRQHTSKATMANKPKNRYNNVTAYDHSRVVLKELPGDEEGDYYNGNFIPGVAGPESYIACQGPTPASAHDFWRMVWQQKSQVIVMVTNLEEKGRIKCHKYWPDLSPSVSADDVRADELPNLQFGVYTVYFKHQTITPLWTVRTFDLQREGEGRMSITQYHYTSWPDHGVPAEPTDLLHFREAVRTSPTSGPLLVHCSAGVGRSGTFIATDHMLNLVQATEAAVIGAGVPDVFAVVKGLRNQRNMMVQTKEQYCFLYFALEMAFTAMKTADNLNLTEALEQFLA